MRGSLSLLVLLAALVPSLPAAAQPALTPPTVIVAPPAPREAHGFYVSEGFGGARAGSELADHMGGALRMRVAAGYRRRAIAVEVWGAANIGLAHHDRHATSTGYLSLDDKPSPPGGEHAHHESAGGLGAVGVDVKYIKTLSSHLEVYARGGLGFAGAGSLGTGRGINVGAGAQLKGKVPVIGLFFWPLFFTGIGPKCTAALFVETGYEFYRLHSYARSTDASLTSWTLGFALGSDF